MRLTASERHAEWAQRPLPTCPTESATVNCGGAVGRGAMLGLINDDVEAFEQCSDNEAFRRRVVDASFALT